MAAQGEQRSPQIPQRILVLRDFCIRTFGVACARCDDICPVDAITLPSELKGLSRAAGAAGGEAGGAQAGGTAGAGAAGTPPVIDADACIACGICEGACDAFSSTRETLSDIHAAARRAALADGERPVILTCRENAAGEEAASNVVTVPCLAMLPAQLLTQLLCEGTRLSIALDLGRCDACPAGSRGAEGIFTEAIAAAERASGETVGFSDALPQKADEGFFAALAQAGGNEDKRDIFSGILDELKDAASGNRRKRTDAHLHDLLEQRERRRSDAQLGVGGSTHFNAYAPGGRARKIMHPKQRMLLAAAAAKPQAAKTIIFTVSATDPTSCDNHLACAKACPTGARLPSAQDGTLAADPLFCIGCGGCVAACPTGSVTLTTLSAAEAACYDGGRKPREESCQ